MAAPAYSQAQRPLQIATPLGKDVLLLTGLSGTEGVSQLFHFKLDLLAENTADVAFEKLIGQPVAVKLDLPDGTPRFLHGICNRLSQGDRDKTFTSYQMEIVPQLWLLTRKVQSRIFQHMSVPDILKKVLAGLDVKFAIQGTFHPRNFCVQYRESDFDFASRLMEEEGIYYFFTHTDAGHQMVVANTEKGHPDLPQQKEVPYEEVTGGPRPEMRVSRWQKTQELRAGKYTLWDHTFELPHKHLAAERKIGDTVQVGQVTHHLKVGGNDALEIYDYPGGYARRFDGVNKGGAPQPAELQKIFEDNQRTVAIRMQQEALPSVTIHGTSDCRQFVAGHKFTLKGHFNADGPYVLTTVEHSGTLTGNYRSGESGELVYENRFSCIPATLPYRPPSETPRPVIAGPQTAVVVGTAGEIIDCEKYGRVKVQFHWDRHGKMDPDSSCWMRVSQPWGGAGWGGMFIPHVGQEVVVQFEEGDPDRPIITGRVYNPECMPPVELPAGKTKSALRDHGGNEIIMEGHGGVQQIAMFSPKSNTKLVMGDKSNPPPGFALSTDANETKTIGINQLFSIGSNSTGKIGANRDFTVGANEKMLVGGSQQSTVVGKQTVMIGGKQTMIVGGKQTETVAGKSTLSVAGKRAETIGGAHSIKNPKMTVNTSGKHTVTAGSKLTGKSPKVNLLASSKLLSKSDGKMDVKAGAKLNQQSGAAMNLKSGAALKMKSSAAMNLKSGAALKAQSSGATSFRAGGDVIAKGSTIKLNSPTKVKGTTLTVS